MQAILAIGLETNSIDQIALMAEKMLEFFRRLVLLKSEPKTSATNSKFDTASSDILHKLDNLTKCLDRLC